MPAIADPRRDASTGTPPTAPPFGMPRRYEDNGADLSLIRANMRVTPSERARRAALRVQALVVERGELRGEPLQDIAPTLEPVVVRRGRAG